MPHKSQWRSSQRSGSASWLLVLSPNQSKNNKNIQKRPAKSSGQSQALLLHSHNNPTERKREIMMMTARTQTDPRSCWKNRLVSKIIYWEPNDIKVQISWGCECKKRFKNLPKAPVDPYYSPQMNARKSERWLTSGRREAHMYCKQCLTCIPIL